MYDKLFKPTHLAELCSSVGLKPSKQFGQNYLINKGIIQKIINGADLDPNDHVIEVGPGFGVLTLALSQEVKKVTTFEIERKLETYWSEQQKTYLNVDVVWGNVLYKFLELQQTYKEYKLVANLPYQITGKVIPLFLEADNPPKTMTVMVQKEVATRICAQKGDMSVLAIAVQYFGKPKLIATVSPGSFFPPPKVTSAVLHITDIQKRKNTKQFFTLVKAGFLNKRKMLVKNLSQVGYDKELLKKALITIGAKETARAQELSVSQWESLLEIVKKV